MNTKIKKLIGQFKEVKKESGNIFVTEQDSQAAELVQQIHFELFDGMFPNDWIFGATLGLLDKMSEYEEQQLTEDNLLEIAGSHVDIYTHDLLKWAVQFYDKIDEAHDEAGFNERRGIVDQCTYGQAVTLDRMAEKIFNFVQEME